MIKGIIFDLEGVLISTYKYHYLAWKSVFDKKKIYFDETINESLLNMESLKILDILLEKACVKFENLEKEELCKQENEIYLSLLENIKEDVNVIEIIKKLKEKDLKLAVCSINKSAKLILDKINLTQYFDVIIDEAKDDHDNFLKIATMLKINPNECLVVKNDDDLINVYFLKEMQNNFKFNTCQIKELKEVIDIINKKNNPIISLKNLKKIYPNNIEAIHDFSLDIYDEEFVVFVGPSGCGKSTVLRMIAGLEQISSGSLLIDNIEMNEAEPKDRNIAMVFQNYALYPHLSVYKNIGFALLNENIPLKYFFNFKYRKERKERIDSLIKEVASKIGLSVYLDRKPANLSGGQRQRVALGRAIIRNPKAFLLDEPLSNLDAKMRQEMRTEIAKLHNDLKTIFIYVTHDQVEAMSMGSKIVVLKDGYIQQVGSPNEIFMHPANKFVAGFIGTPQMNFFNALIEKKDDSLKIKIANEYYLELPLVLQEKIDLNKYLNKEIILGVRPKAINIASNSSIKGKISLFEQLGDEALIYFKLNDDKEYVLSMLTYQQFNLNEDICLSFDLEHASLFDKDSEESIIL